MRLQHVLVGRYPFPPAGRVPWLFAVITTAGLVLAIGAWQALSIRERTYAEGIIAANLAQVQNEIRLAVDARVIPLTYAAHVWEPWKPLPPREPAYVPGYRSVGWVDPDLHVRWLTLDDAQPGTQASGTAEASRHAAAELARVQQRPAITRPIRLDSADREFNVYVPVYQGSTLKGFLFGAFRFHDLLADVLSPTLASEYAILIRDGDEEVYSRSLSHLSYAPQWAQQFTIELYSARWTVKIWPSQRAIARLHSRAPQMVLIAGTLVALLLGATVYWAQTARHRTQVAEHVRAELEQKAHELSRSNADLRQYAYVASHHLQEPLRAITAFTQLLAERYRGRLDSEADEFIGFAVEGARRMKTLVSDLLAYSSVDSGILKRRPVECETVLANVLTSLQPALNEARARVTHDLLPVVLADEAQLGLVFQHLLANALKFRGPEPVRIHVSAERQSGEWRFAVRDNGIGLEPRFAEQIFLIFQRLNAETPGTGIGLAIAKKIMEGHGGRIWVESELGQGATFYFTLPVSGA